MDIDAGMVMGVVGIGSSAIALLRTRQEAKDKAYADARKDLGDCKKTSDAQAKKIDELDAGLARCLERHDAAEAQAAEAHEKAERAERLSVAMRGELDEVRRSISSGR